MSSNASTTLRHPTPREQNDRLFNAVWEAIKEWDIRRSPANGYAGASGTDVCTILDAIVRVLPASSSFSKTLHELAGRPPDSPPQIVSARDELAREFRHNNYARIVMEIVKENGGPAVRHEMEARLMSEYASSYRAALTRELEISKATGRVWKNLAKLRENQLADECSADKEIAEICEKQQLDLEAAEAKAYAAGVAAGNERIARQAAESKLKDAANEIHMLERAAESHKYTVSDLVAQGDGLREALREQKRNAVEIIRLRQKDIDPDSINISPEWVVAECNKALGAEARLSGTEKGTK